MRMRFTDYTLLASRNLMHRRSRSMLAILAIVIGATSVTIMLALVIGAKDFYYNQFKNTGQIEQIMVNPQSGLDFKQSQQAANCDSCTKLTNEVADKILKYPHVDGLSPIADVNVFETASLNGHKQVVQNAQGYQPNGIIKHIFVAGRDFNDKDGTGKVIISQDYADAWGYENKYDNIIGKQITLNTGSSFTGAGAKLSDPLVQFNACQDGCQADEATTQQKPSAIKATIVGVQSDDNGSIFVPLKWAEGLLTSQRYEITKQDQAAYVQAMSVWKSQGQRGAEPTPKFTLVKDNQLADDGYSALAVKADSVDNVNTVAGQIRKLGVGAATAQDYVNSQLQVFNIISYILAAIGSIALFVAAIGVINTMVTAVLERTREIGVMRAVGAKRSTVRRLFTLEASLLGFLGGTIGVAIGYALIQLANIFINNQLAENAVASRNIISLPMWLILTVIIATTVIGMLAGLYPASRAARLDPVEALRHE